MINNRVAILGATGHIAQSLIQGFLSRNDCELFLFARNRDKLNCALSRMTEFRSEHVYTPELSKFQDLEYNVVINCIGIGNPNELVRDPYQIFRITEDYDNLIIQYLKAHSSTLYINFSSGAAYGSDFESPASMDKLASYQINKLSVQDFYGIAKLNTEAKHRSLSHNRIIDLRIFGFFSSFIDLNSNYLLTNIMAAIRTGQTLLTSPHNIIRDYVHPYDLDAIIQLCMNSIAVNTAMDVYSLKPIPKFELLDYFTTHYGLNYQIQERKNQESATGTKLNYYTENDQAKSIGYSPIYSSLQSVVYGYQRLNARTNG